MIPQISNALAKGFTSRQIIDFLIKKFPEHSDKIKAALASGYTVDQVLRYLGGGRKVVNQETLPQTEHEKTLGTDIKRRETANKAALSTIAVPATALASQAAGAALSRALPAALRPLAGDIASSSLPSTPNHPIQPIQLSQLLSPEASPKTTESQQPPVNQNVASVTQPQPVAQPEGISNPKEYLEKLGIKDKVDELLKSGNTPEQVAAVLGMKSGQGRLKAEIDPELVQKIDEYSKIQEKKSPEIKKKDQGIAAIGGMASGMMENFYQQAFDSLKAGKSQMAGVKEPLLQAAKPAFEAGQIKSPEDLKRFADYWKNQKKSGTISKNETVASTKGIGEVKEVRNGQAIIDVDGKLHKVKESELEAEPKEVADSKIEFDINNIPEKLRSAALNEVYVPADRSRITIKYNSGNQKKRYMFWRKEGQTIDESLIKKLREGSQLPISSGINFWGAWNSSEADSRGTVAFHDLKNLSQAYNEDAIDDNSKPYWFIEEEEIYYHPYMEKAREELKEKEKKFNEKNKKSKKKTA